MRDQLRSAESAVPADAWAAIQSGMKGGIPTSVPQSGGSFGMGFSLAAGAALLISLATYSEVRDQSQSHMELTTNQHMVQDESSTPNHMDNTVVLSETDLSENAESVANDNAPIADIVVVQKAPSSVIVNEAPNQNRIQLEALQPILSHGSEAIELANNEDSNNTHDHSALAIPELKTKDIPNEVEGLTALEETTEEVDAIIGASEIFGYAPMTVKFDNLGQGSDHVWDFGKYGVKYDKSPELTFDEPGVYSVYLNVSNETGEDMVSDVIQVTVKEGSHLYYPNAVTPNGDGINDTYEIDAYLIKSFLMIITNDHGDIVFQTRDVNQGWSCEEAIQDMSGTKYFVTYKATGVDGKVYTKDRMLLTIIH